MADITEDQKVIAKKVVKIKGKSYLTTLKKDLIKLAVNGDTKGPVGMVSLPPPGSPGNIPLDLWVKVLVQMGIMDLVLQPLAVAMQAIYDTTCALPRMSGEMATFHHWVKSNLNSLEKGHKSVVTDLTALEIAMSLINAVVRRTTVLGDWCSLTSGLRWRTLRPRSGTLSGRIPA